MKVFALISISMLIVLGCASHHPTTTPSLQIKDKEDEIEVLQEEIKLIVLSLEKYQRRTTDDSFNPSNPSHPMYSIEAQAHDLDKTVATLRQAHHQLGKQLKQIRRKYGTGHEGRY